MKITLKNILVVIETMEFNHLFKYIATPHFSEEKMVFHWHQWFQGKHLTFMETSIQQKVNYSENRFFRLLKFLLT